MSTVNSHPKTDVRHWLAKIKRRRYENDGSESLGNTYIAQMQFRRRRMRFNLHTANKSAAAARARKIYLCIMEEGWDSAIEKYGMPGGHSKRAEENLSSTVGELIKVVEQISTARPASLATYFKAIRKIAADIHEIEKGRKYDAKGGGHEAWIEKVDSIRLHTLTPATVLEWKVKFLKASDPEHLRSAKTTVNSLLRNAKALFAKKHLKYLRESLKLPDPLPFEDVGFEKQPSMRYHSKLDAASLLKAAKSDLLEDNPEAYKIILLGLMCGLRKSEMDTLMWDAFD